MVDFKGKNSFREVHGFAPKYTLLEIGYHPNSLTAHIRVGPCPDNSIKTEPVAEDGPHSKERGGWCGAHVLSDAHWPTQHYSVQFEGHTLYIYPKEAEFLPAVFLREVGLTVDKKRAVISRFLSSWSWVEKSGSSIVEWTEGSHLFRTQRYQAGINTLHFDFICLPEYQSPEARLALAFYREGLALGV